MTAPAAVARHSRAGGAHLRTLVVQRERHKGAVAAGFVIVVDPRGWPVHFLYVGDSGRRLCTVNGRQQQFWLLWPVFTRCQNRVCGIQCITTVDKRAPCVVKRR